MNPRPRFTRFRVLPTLALLALGAAPAAAHEQWLAPSRWRAGPGDTIIVRASVGDGFAGEDIPFASSRNRRFVVRADRELDLGPVARDGDPIWARFTPADAGGALLAYVSDFASITLAAAAFDAYLADEGLDGPLAARRARARPGPGRERYRRCAKTWVEGDDGARATTPFGLPGEIVPLSPPGGGASLRVRVQFGGRPLAGVCLNAWCRPFGSGADAGHGAPVAVSWTGRTDDRGEAVVPVDTPGEWLLGAVHMIPSEDPAADWESTWMSLTFGRP